MKEHNDLYGLSGLALIGVDAGDDIKPSPAGEALNGMPAVWFPASAAVQRVSDELITRGTEGADNDGAVPPFYAMAGARVLRLERITVDARRAIQP